MKTEQQQNKVWIRIRIRKEDKIESDESCLNFEGVVVEDDVDTERARGGDEAQRRIRVGKENHSQERPFPRLPQQTLASSHRWRSKLPSSTILSFLFFSSLCLFCFFSILIILMLLTNSLRLSLYTCTVLPSQPPMEFETFSSTLVLELKARKRKFFGLTFVRNRYVFLYLYILR